MPVYWWTYKDKTISRTYYSSDLNLGVIKSESNSSYGFYYFCNSGSTVDRDNKTVQLNGYAYHEFGRKNKYSGNWPDDIYDDLISTIPNDTKSFS